jgi:hypothetical protein
MKSCLCIFLGLPRTILKCFPNIKKNLIENNNDFNFKYIVNTEGTESEINLIKNTLNIDDSNIIIFTIDKNKIESSFQIYIHRLYQCLKKEENNFYDIYINLRFDIIINKSINLNNYLDKYCIITGTFTRDCDFHNRDWDLMAIGSNFNYKMYNYPIVNEVLKNWLKEDINIVIDNNLNTDIKDEFISDNELKEINNKCGLITDQPNSYFSRVIKNLLNNGGNFIVSEKFEQIHASIIR